MTKLTGEIIYVGDPQYEDARQNLIKLYQSFPHVIVFALTVEDVKNALKWSRENNITIRIRGGRNSTEGWCSITNGIVIDISKMKNIDIDSKNLTVRVGAGVLQGELLNALSDTGFYTSLGSEGILGAIGAILGGGPIGILSRHLGPGCDSLLEVETVVTKGSKSARIVTANKCENCDLYWASRGGGGGNFGIVTSYTLKLYVAPKFIVVWQVVFPFKSLINAYNTWQHWAPFVPDTRLSSTASVFNNRLVIKGIFLGTEKELGNLLDPIKNVPNGVFEQTQEPFGKFFHYTPGVEQPFQKYTPMWVFKPYPEEALKIIKSYMKRAPSDETNFYSLAWGGNVQEEPPEGTAFPCSHRKAILYSEPGAEWSDCKIIAEALSWVENFRLELQPYFKGGYVNVLDRAIAQYGKEYYEDNFDRLQEVKKKWDPHKIFYFEQSITNCGLKNNNDFDCK